MHWNGLFPLVYILLGVLTCTDSHNHHRTQDAERPHHPKTSLALPFWSQASPASSPGNHWPLLRSSRPAFSTMSPRQDPRVATFETSSLRMPLRFTHSLLLLRNTPAYRWTGLPTPSPAQGHVGWFQFGAMRNRAAVNTCVPIFLVNFSLVF